jgi:uncharacterized membrane protein YhhN
MMSYAALLQFLSLQSWWAGLVYAGTLIFMVSDFVLLLRNFRADIRIPKKPFVVMLTYILAQAAIVAGMMNL